MNEQGLLIIVTVLIPVSAAAIAGVVWTTIRMTRLETQMDAVWRWWEKHHVNGKDEN